VKYFLIAVFNMLLIAGLATKGIKIEKNFLYLDDRRASSDDF